MAALLLAASLAPLAGAEEVSVQKDKATFQGRLQADDFDAYYLPDSGPGQQLFYKLEPQQTQGAFDVYLFTAGQYPAYLLGDDDPEALRAHTKIYRLHEMVETEQLGWVLVVDNANTTSNGATSRGELVYTLELELVTRPLWERYWWALAGGATLGLLAVLGGVAWRRSAGSPATPAGGPGPAPLATGGRPLPSAPPVSYQPQPPPAGAPPASGPVPAPPGPPGPEAGPRPTYPPATVAGSKGSLPAGPTPPASARGGMLVECPGCKTRIKHDPRSGQITCPSCGLSGRIG